MRLTQFPAVGGLNIFQTTTESSFVTQVGQKFQVDGGESELALVSAGAVNIASGVLIQAPALIADHQNIAVLASYAIGSVLITATLNGSTVATSNQYQNGYLIVNDGLGKGVKYKIQSNSSATAGGTITITLEDPIAVAIDSTTKVCLEPNPYAAVIISPTTYTNKVVGVSLYPIPAGSYGLIVSKGTVPCLNHGGTAIGLGVARSSSTAGAVETVAATTAEVGIAQQTGVDAKYYAISVNL